MPSFNYRCSCCGDFVHWQKITDDPLTQCPTCEGPVKRLIGRGVGIQFRGPGFYITETRGGDERTAEAADDGS